MFTNGKSYGRSQGRSKFGCAETAAVPCQWRQGPSEAAATARGGRAEVSVRGALHLTLPGAGRCGWKCTGTGAGAGDAYVRVARAKATWVPRVSGRRLPAVHGAARQDVHSPPPPGHPGGTDPPPSFALGSQKPLAA